MYKKKGSHKIALALKKAAKIGKGHESCTRDRISASDSVRQPQSEGPMTLKNDSTDWIKKTEDIASPISNN